MLDLFHHTGFKNHWLAKGRLQEWEITQCPEESWWDTNQQSHDHIARLLCTYWRDCRACCQLQWNREPLIYCKIALKEDKGHHCEQICHTLMPTCMLLWYISNIAQQKWLNTASNMHTYTRGFSPVLNWMGSCCPTVSVLVLYFYQFERTHYIIQQFSFPMCCDGRTMSH